MPIRKLAEIKKIGKYDVGKWPGDGVPTVSDLSTFIKLNTETEEITFKMQSGLLRKKGSNGVQPATLLQVVRIMVEAKASARPGRELALVLTKIDEALLWLNHQTEVEGKVVKHEEGVDLTVEK